MKIIVEMSKDELNEMGCEDSEDFKDALINQLDYSVMPHGYYNLTLVGYNIEVIVK